jgi:pilus assembly protein FimV
MRVKPILQFGLVVGALALPGVAWPLGLGKLTVDSALGQPLSARIELLSATKDELDSLTAKVADSSLYRQNNLTYQGVLTRTRITVERGPGGVAYLRVTSPTPVTEPYLDLLVDVNWSAGRVVRDYTFLQPLRSNRSRPCASARLRPDGLRRRLRRELPRRPRAATATAMRSSAAIRCRRSPRNTNPKPSRWNRCWWRCSRATRMRSTAPT